jgi:hypothetical protein
LKGSVIKRNWRKCWNALLMVGSRVDETSAR